jgi:ABC-type microcin C transport system duplicated ATPase subunit YejF
VTALAVLGLVPHPGRVVGGRVRFDGRDLLELSEDRIALVRGREIAMVFQEPMTSLNPVLSIGVQLTEGMRRHLGLSRAEAKARAARRHRLGPRKLAGREIPRAKAAAPHRKCGHRRLCTAGVTGLGAAA